MSVPITLIWPLEGTAPTPAEAWEFYNQINPFFEPSSVADWLDRCVEAHFELALRVGLKPFTIVQDYSMIDQTGEFPEDPESWFSPEELETSIHGFMSKMGLNDPDAMVMCEYWIREIRQKASSPSYTEPTPKILTGEDPYLVGIWRTEALGLLISNLESMAQAAHTCRNNGIERLAFCQFV